MAEPHVLLCGGLRPADAPNSWRRCERTSLEIGAGEDVHLRIEQLTAQMMTTVPKVAMDLLEIASYVFAADQTLTRGGTTRFDYGNAWRRQLRFLIPVRCPEIWQTPEISRVLSSALGFVTDDEYEFRFSTAQDPAQPESCLFDCVAPNGNEFREVVLFSGGLDSLCGAVEETLVNKHRVVLVSHRSSTRVWARQQELFTAIRERVTNHRSVPLHVGVTINKGEEHNRDFTQRSRSFVFACVAAVVARQVGLDRIRFYENGCTSLNLPVSPELVGARASRTTHPQSLARFSDLFSMLFDTPFAVQNPYQTRTKGEILQQLREWGHADLCRLTCSCGHVWGKLEAEPHCGCCSQCVERRFSVLVAGLTAADDPPCRYACDPITGERGGPDLTFAERYIGTAREIERIDSPRAFAVRFPEVNEAIPYLGCSADEAAQFIHNLSRRNAAGITQALCDVITANPNQIVNQTVPARSLLGVVLGRAVTPTAVPPASASAASGSGFVVDVDRFEVRLHGRSCTLGNTLEFRLIERLHQARSVFLSITRLGEDVWSDAGVSKNAVQAVVSNLRRKLRESGIEGIVINGSQKDHYQLVISRQ